MSNIKVEVDCGDKCYELECIYWDTYGEVEISNLVRYYIDGGSKNEVTTLNVCILDYAVRDRVTVPRAEQDLKDLVWNYVSQHFIDDYETSREMDYEARLGY